MTRQRNQQPGDLYRHSRAPTSKLEALEPPSPASLRRPKYMRSHSDSRRSRSGTATSRCEDLDSLCFHNLAGDDDGDTMSAYAYSDAGSIVSGRQRSGTTAAALANLATEVDVDSLYQNSAHSLMNDDSLYTSNDPMSRSYQNHHDDLALERAIQQGQRRAQTEARDEVMCPRDHLQWKKATDEAHALHERARNSMEGQTLGNGSYRQSKNTRSSATTKDLSIQDRKNARRQARLAHANRKHGHSSSKELPSLTGTEESSMSTAPSSTLADSPRQGQQQRGRRATVHAADGKRSPPLIALDVSSASQPSLMLGRQNSVTTFSSSTWEESATATMSSSTIQPVHKPHRRPPVTNTSKDLAKLDSSNESSGKERGRGRSRSLTRTVVRSISRSLSRTIRKIRGKDDDNKTKKKRSNKCTCPGENIVLKSCPRHGRRAQKLIEETEKKVKKHRHRRSSKRGDMEGSSRKHRHHHHHHDDDACGSQEHQPQQERGRSRLPSSTNAAIMSGGKAGPRRSRSMAEF